MKTSRSKYAFMMLRSKSTIWIFLVLMFGVYQLLGSIGILFSVYDEKNETKILYIETTEKKDEIKKYIEKISGVEGISEYQEYADEIQIGDYRASVQLVGIEKEFLQQWKELSAEQISDAMPYVILDNRFYKSLKNEKNKKISKKQWGMWIKENSVIRFSGGKEARILEYVDLDEAEEGKVYTTTEGLAMLSAKEMVLQGKPIEEEEKEQEEKNAEQRIEEEKNSNAGKWIVRIENGNVLKKIRNTLEKNHVKAVIDGEEKEKQWENEEENGKYRLAVSGMFLIAGTLLIFLQEKLWKADHRAFLEYMQACNRKKDVMRKIYRQKNWFLLLGGIAGGVIYYFIKEIIWVEVFESI